MEQIYAFMSFYILCITSHMVVHTHANVHGICITVNINFWREEMVQEVLQWKDHHMYLILSTIANSFEIPIYFQQYQPTQ